ncbi:MAG: GTP cyclohydrolase FolE2 [Pseudobdellovibrio sp.]
MKVSDQIHSDVQAELDTKLAGLSWVGMGQIQSALNMSEFNIPCLLDIGVNLLSGHRGIHMSRLYQAHLDCFLQQKINFTQMNSFLSAALKSQGEISSEIAAKINLQFPMKTTSLKSNLTGYRNYPLQIICEKNKISDDETNRIWLQFEILYSSTCPQSASLSIEVLKTLKSIPERLPATPHAQRSKAIIRVQVLDFTESIIQNLIKSIETTLQTPVQTIVKKVDEMEFAKLNAQNLMFCEDAARLVAKKLSHDESVVGFSIFCEHQESLHPHNASSLIMRNFIAPTRLNFI